MEIKVIKVDPEFVAKVEDADYTYNSRKDVITMYLNDGFDTSLPTFVSFKKEMEDAYGAFNRLKGEIEKTYIFTDHDFDDKQVNWNLDYSTCELTVRY